MKKVYPVLILLISSTLLLSANFAFAERGDRTSYYKKAVANQWGDYKYESPIKKDKIKQIPYYEVNYSGSVILNEKHYNEKGALVYASEYHYDHGGAYSKYEVHFKKAEIRIKLKNPLGHYSKIKYLKFTENPTKQRKMFKFEEYHTNGKIRLASYFNSKEKLEKQEEFFRDGQQLYVRYYKIIGSKNLLWKMDVYNDYGNYEGYWTYTYDKEGEKESEKFHPARVSSN